MAPLLRRCAATRYATKEDIFPSSEQTEQRGGAKARRAVTRVVRLVQKRLYVARLRWLAASQGIAAARRRGRVLPCPARIRLLTGLGAPRLAPSAWCRPAWSGPAH